jgi:hypothetical protein
MYGAMLGGFASLIFILSTDSVSWWWLLWGSLIGLVAEIAVRVGAGGDFADAVVSSIDIASTIGDCSGSCDCGDSGGGDGGGD